MLENKKVNPKSIKLRDKFDKALLRYDGESYVYQAELIIEILTVEMINDLKRGLYEYDDYNSLEEAAEAYAEDDFYYNYYGQLGKYYPKYEHST